MACKCDIYKLGTWLRLFSAHVTIDATSLATLSLPQLSVLVKELIAGKLELSSAATGIGPRQLQVP